MKAKSLQPPRKVKAPPYCPVRIVCPDGVMQHVYVEDARTHRRLAGVVRVDIDTLDATGGTINAVLYLRGVALDLRARGKAAAWHHHLVERNLVLAAQAARQLGDELAARATQGPRGNARCPRGKADRRCPTRASRRRPRDAGTARRDQPAAARTASR